MNRPHCPQVLILSLTLFISLLFLRANSVAQVGLIWDAPTTNADGTPLTDLAGYKVYFGTASRSYGAPINIGNVTTYTVTGLTPGITYYFAATAYDTSNNESDFSNEVYVMVGVQPLPSATTLVSPTGTIATNSPTYIWKAVPSSTWYYLWVNDSTGTRITQWYTASQAGCPSGTGTCSATPAVALANGSGTWWIQTWSDAGYGPWSTAMNFNVNPCLSAPPAATLVFPSDTIANATPTYTWNAVPCSTSYYLEVNDSTGIRITQWYTASEAGCPSGTGTCSITPTTPLAPGGGNWWIQTWDSQGYGPWSDARSYNVSY